MLGLGSNITKAGKIGKPIVKDGLVLKHGYTRGPVQPCSTGAASFVASSTDYITTGVGNSLTPLVTGFTASIWAKFNATDQDYIVLASSNGSHQRMYIGTQGGSFDFGIGNAAWNAGTNTATTDWTHLALTVTTGGVATFYINGVVDRADSSIGTFDTDGTFGSDFAVGRQGSTSDFYTDGYACNVGIWSAALTQPQVKSIMHKDYAALSASEKTNLVSWWNLDSTVEDLGTAVYDNHGGGLGTELFTNGGFSSDSDWAKGDGWTIANGVASHNASLGAGDLTQDLSLTSGKSYRITIEITATDTTELYFTTDSGDYVEVTGSPVGVHSHVFIADESTHSVGVRGSSNWDGSIDNVSVKLVNGNTGTLS